MSTQFKRNRQEKALVDYLNGISVVQIAIEFGVSRSTIYNWLRKQKARGVIKIVPTQKEVMNLK
jgi:transposase